MVKFSPGKDNAKLAKLEKKTGKKVYSFSLLSGHTCPFAKDCMAKAVETPLGMRLEEGPNTEFRCFSASQEVLFPSLYAQRKHNTEVLAMPLKKGLLSPKDGAKMIHASLPKDAEIVRIHVAGDFNSLAYLDAWLIVCRMNPNVEFYCYTKSIPLFFERWENLPENLSVTFSRGGKADRLIDEWGLKEAVVVTSQYRARKMGLTVDTNDYKALRSRESFALVVHGVQPKGTVWAKSVQRQKKLKQKATV